MNTNEEIKRQINKQLSENEEAFFKEESEEIGEEIDRFWFNVSFRDGATESDEPDWIDETKWGEAERRLWDFIDAHGLYDGGKWFENREPMEYSDEDFIRQRYEYGGVDSFVLGTCVFDYLESHSVLDFREDLRMLEAVAENNNGIRVTARIHTQTGDTFSVWTVDELFEHLAEVVASKKTMEKQKKESKRQSYRLEDDISGSQPNLFCSHSWRYIRRTQKSDKGIELSDGRIAHIIEREGLVVMTEEFDPPECVEAGHPDFIVEPTERRKKSGGWGSKFVFEWHESDE